MLKKLGDLLIRWGENLVGETSSSASSGKQTEPDDIGTIIYDNVKMLPLEDISDQDFFIVGYPKSGNTWFQYLVASIVYGTDTEFAGDKVVKRLIPDLSSSFLMYYTRFQTPMFFRTHQLPAPYMKRVVYLMRDGRDVMVSCYHFLEALGVQGLTMLDLVRGKSRLYAPHNVAWHEHISAWMNDKQPDRRLIIIKYEDLKTQPVKELRKFCELAGLDRSDEDLQKAVEKSSFATLRRKEKELGFADKSWPKDKCFFRRGIIGSYKDEMTPEVLDAFLEEAGETMRKYGYL